MTPALLELRTVWLWAVASKANWTSHFTSPDKTKIGLCNLLSHSTANARYDLNRFHEIYNILFSPRIKAPNYTRMILLAIFIFRIISVWLKSVFPVNSSKRTTLPIFFHCVHLIYLIYTASPLYATRFNHAIHKKNGQPNLYKHKSSLSLSINAQTPEEKGPPHCHPSYEPQNSTAGNNPQNQTAYWFVSP